jgi:hypothetical protein
MKNLKGGRIRLPLKTGANPKIFNLSKKNCWELGMHQLPLKLWSVHHPP